MRDVEELDWRDFVPPAPNVGVGVGALVVNESDRVLLVQRPNSLETDRGIWSQPGRRLEFAEEPIDAVRKYFLERFGLKLTSMELLTVHTHISRQPGLDVQWVSICYLCTRIGHLEDEECREPHRWDWFPITALPTSLTTYTAASLHAFFHRLRA